MLLLSALSAPMLMTSFVPLHSVARCRTPKPRAVLDRMVDCIVPGGLLILTTPFTWMEEYTPMPEWYGSVSLRCLTGGVHAGEGDTCVSSMVLLSPPPPSCCSSAVNVRRLGGMPGGMSSEDALKEYMAPHFELLEEKNVRCLSSRLPCLLPKPCTSPSRRSLHPTVPPRDS